MQFAVLVYEKPGTYEALSAAELEQMTARVSRDRAAPGLHWGCSAAVDRDGERGARRGRRDVDHRRPVCEYQGGLWRLLPLRGGESRSGARDRGSLPRGSARRGGGGPSVGASPRHGRRWLIERVFRERWRRVLASMVGYVGDFDLAEESTQEAFAIALRLPGTTATISGWVFSVAQVPIEPTSAGFCTRRQPTVDFAAGDRRRALRRPGSSRLACLCSRGEQQDDACAAWIRLDRVQCEPVLRSAEAE